jgi:hypothetical protein
VVALSPKKFVEALKMVVLDVIAKVQFSHDVEGRMDVLLGAVGIDAYEDWHAVRLSCFM